MRGCAEGTPGRLPGVQEKGGPLRGTKPGGLLNGRSDLHIVHRLQQRGQELLEASESWL